MKLKLTVQEFVDKSELVHNKKYNYSQVQLKGLYQKVTIICPNHGSFSQSPYCHLKGGGCAKCGRNILRDKYIHSNDQYITQVEKKHSNKFDYTLLSYRGMHTSVKLICKKHNLIIEKSAQAFLLQSHGCPKCSSEGKSQQHTSSVKKFVEKAKKTWGELYDYSLVDYKHEQTLITLKCKTHGEFLVKPNRHLYSLQGCSMCVSSSKGENIIETFLKENNISYKPQKTFELCINSRTKRKLRFDFYIPDFNLCIEFDGLFHYKSWGDSLGDLQETKRKDRIKTRFCEKNSIDLLRIPYWKAREINKILTLKLLNYDSINLPRNT